MIILPSTETGTSYLEDSTKEGRQPEEGGGSGRRDGELVVKLRPRATVHYLSVTRQRKRGTISLQTVKSQNTLFRKVIDKMVAFLVYK